MSLLPAFSERVIDWQRQHGRHALPWQNTRDAYRIWLSEIMLQQTQVSTVLGYYERFLARYPSVSDLAASPLDEVLGLWSGLGYYARARNLHRCAQVVHEQHGGQFPNSAAVLETLPGIGRSTAAAIAAFSSGERAAILDGNVKRVLCRHAGVRGDPGSTRTLKVLWDLAEQRLPADSATLKQDMVAYTQGLMDLGAMLCTRTRPACEKCPVAADCVAKREGLQALLPERRQRLALPTRTTHWFLLRHEEQVLLMQRPAQGLWGGLWVPPEAESVDELPRVLVQLGLQAASPIRALTPFSHTFSHFRLDVTPWELRTTSALVLADSAGIDSGRWIAAHELATLGLPKPVSHLLRSMFNSSLIRDF
jgi:A/G-specific adenine glycosylase